MAINWTPRTKEEKEEERKLRNSISPIDYRDEWLNLENPTKKDIEFYKKKLPDMFGQKSKNNKDVNTNKTTKDYIPKKTFPTKTSNETYDEYFKRVRLITAYKKSKLTPLEFYKKIRKTDKDSIRPKSIKSTKTSNETYDEYFKRVRLVSAYKKSGLTPDKFYKLIRKIEKEPVKPKTKKQLKEEEAERLRNLIPFISTELQKIKFDSSKRYSTKDIDFLNQEYDKLDKIISTKDFFNQPEKEQNEVMDLQEKVHKQIDSINELIKMDKIKSTKEYQDKIKKSNQETERIKLELDKKRQRELEEKRLKKEAFEIKDGSYEVINGSVKTTKKGNKYDIQTKAKLNKDLPPKVVKAGIGELQDKLNEFKDLLSNYNNK